MLDKNGIEIKTGDIVKITGAYFKNDNATYFVKSSPEDPGWCGNDYCLYKIDKRNGKLSTAKGHICFWPINERRGTMYEFLRLLNVLDLVLQYLTNWMSYVAIVLAAVLAVFQIAYFVLDKKHSNM